MHNHYALTQHFALTAEQRQNIRTSLAQEDDDRLVDLVELAELQDDLAEDIAEAEETCDDDYAEPPNLRREKS